MLSPAHPTRDEELDLHRRLVEGDPVAPSELADKYLHRLILFLRKTNDSGFPRNFIEEAAGDSIVSLVKSPIAFDPSRTVAAQPLFAYLKRAAQRDLINILNKEKRHQRGRQSLESVELLSSARNYREEDPAESLERREEAEKADNKVLSLVRRGLSAEQQQCLALMAQGERKTAAFAKALGIEDLSKNEQRIKVKRVKDMLKQRIRRTGNG
jgi:hypothetical protein